MRYRNLIYSAARRTGLNEDECEQVVQDTLIAVAKKMPGFTYDPAKDSFKGWLLTVTRWRVLDQFQKRACEQGRRTGTASPQSDETATIERVADPAGSQLEAIWDEEWDKHILQTTLALVKRAVQPRQYEIYYLHVVLGQSIPEVTKALGVSSTQVYLAKHRVGRLIRKEAAKMKKTLS